MKKEDLNKLKNELEEKSKCLDIGEQDFANFETQAKEKFENAMVGYVNHKKYDNIKEYIKMITDTQTKINCLVIESEQGVGKTTIVKNILKELNKEVLYINSYTTSLAFYKAVYHNRYNQIILDDVYGLYSDEKGISILRALTNTEEVRYIKYQSTSDKLDVPSSFIFEGSIIILTNKITDEMDNSLLGRSIHRKINFTLKEKLNFVEQIIKFQYDLKEEEHDKIMKFVNENVDETTKNFSFRSVLKIVEFYKHNKNIWEELTIEELERDEELVFVKNLMDLPTEERNTLWLKETGRTIRTLQRKIKQIRQNDTTTEVSCQTKEKGVLNNGN